MKKINFRWQLVVYDILILFVVDLLLLVFYRSNDELSLNGIVLHASIGFVCVFTARIFGSIYRQIWRYGGIQCYIRLLSELAFAATLAIELTCSVRANREGHLSRLFVHPSNESSGRAGYPHDLSLLLQMRHRQHSLR